MESDNTTLSTEQLVMENETGSRAECGLEMAQGINVQPPASGGVCRSSCEARSRKLRLRGTEISLGSCPPTLKKCMKIFAE
ncbi:hypothetical protein RB195_009967 [Necator americanus]|uniref:Uncharacterized protein n=1 Tax=Necator americanus TaxID=51031 RepID=A0ABR1CW95_NECAM